jgi:hypothetical protein
MGKRGNAGNFKRRKDDLYSTSFAAAEMLTPWLRAEGITEFDEPCAGEDCLRRHLEFFGLTCNYAGDISRGQDALAIKRYNVPVITNPPHTRRLMHPLITHFLGSAPLAWLLIDLDWVANLQAVPFLPRCSDIVIIGRAKWFEGTAHTSKDNFGWYRFAADHRGATRIHNHRVKAAPRRRVVIGNAVTGISAAPLTLSGEAAE